MAEPTGQRTTGTRSRSHRRANGEGGLHQVTKNGRRLWKGTIYVTIDGKVSEKTCSDVNQARAKVKLDHLIKKWKGSTDPSDETVAQFLNWWIDNHGWKFVDRDRLDEETVKDYENSFKYVKAKLGEVPLIDLTAKDIWDLLEYLSNEGRAYYRKGQVVGRGPLAHRTIVKIRAQLEKALATATSLGKIPVNVAKLVDVPATVKPVPKKALTEDEARLVIKTAEAAAAARPQDLLIHAFLLVGFVNGLRPGENYGLQWHRIIWSYHTDEEGRVFGAIDIDASLKHKKAYIRDGEYIPERFEMGGVKRDVQASNRIMLLPPEVVQVLQRWQFEQKKWQRAAGPVWNNEFDLLFTSETGTPILHQNLSRRIDRVLKPTGLGHWTIGELTRHSFATRLQSDLQPAILTRSMGHVRGSTTAERNYIRPEKQIIADHLGPMERFFGNDAS